MRKKIKISSNNEDKDKDKDLKDNLQCIASKDFDLWLAPSASELLREERIADENERRKIEKSCHSKIDMAKLKKILFSRIVSKFDQSTENDQSTEDKDNKQEIKKKFFSISKSEDVNKVDSGIADNNVSDEEQLEMNDSIFLNAEEIEAVDLKVLFSNRKKNKKVRNSHYRLAKFLHIDQDLDIDNARAKNRLAELAEEIERQEARENLQAWSKKVIASSTDLIPMNFAEGLAENIEEYLIDKDVYKDEIDAVRLKQKVDIISSRADKFNDSLNNSVSGITNSDDDEII